MTQLHISGWTGSHWTLKFADLGNEQGFLRHNAERLARTAFIAAFIASVPAFAALVISIERGAQKDVVYWQASGSQPVWLLTMFVLLMGFGIRCLLQRMNFAQREVFVAFPAAVLPVFFAAGDMCYGAKLRGLDPLVVYPNLWWSDTHFVLVLANVTVALHLTLPIRWHILVVQEVLTVLVYGGCAFGLGGPASSFWNFTLLSSLIFLTAIGKRHLDSTDRAMFSRLVAQRTLRTEAEFQLSMVSNQMRNSQDDLQSVMSTTPSGEAFRQLEGNNQEQQLGTISMMGQWLVREAEVQLTDPIHFLGSGGFGVVVSGSFHGTPVAVKFPVCLEGAQSLADIGNELRILRKLKHPNIVMFHGACFDFENGDVALVLELLHGQLSNIGMTAGLATAAAR